MESIPFLSDREYIEEVKQRLKTFSILASNLVIEKRLDTIMCIYINFSRVVVSGILEM